MKMLAGTIQMLEDFPSQAAFYWSLCSGLQGLCLHVIGIVTMLASNQGLISLFVDPSQTMVYCLASGQMFKQTIVCANKPLLLTMLELGY